jgi:hypothetical protein
MKRFYMFAVAFALFQTTANAKINDWLGIIGNTKVQIKYYSPAKSDSFVTLSGKQISESEPALVQEFKSQSTDVRLIFRKYGSHIELSGGVSAKGNKDQCFTLRIIFPLKASGHTVWCRDLDSTQSVSEGDTTCTNYVEASSLIPPTGAFNVVGSDNGGYGDKLGEGMMSFYPLAAVSTDSTGYGWGVDMGVPIVFKLSYDPAEGMISEFDLATSSKTENFPGRTYFRLLLFEYQPEWHMRAAMKQYYRIEPEYFKKRVTKEGIWLPFSPLHETRGWEDFDIAFHETDWRTMDRGLSPALPTIEADRLGGVLSFQYTDPWEEEIPIPATDSTYEQVTSKAAIGGTMAEYISACAALDKDGRLIARKLETPWFKTGWAVSLNINTDPDLKGLNAFNFVYRREISPALRLDADGIYFDCLEWYWQYDMDYDTSHFTYTDYPLTFSSSPVHPSPAVWSYASDYKLLKKVADELHSQGKLVMGNGYGWIPFEAGEMDLFGSELNWHSKEDTGIRRLLFYRALSYQKPVVFLLNEGMDDKDFTEPPYDGYRKYFQKMLFYGFFPSFFSVNSSNNVYWSDSVKYNQGRPFFRKYMPLIKEISEAGWEPITYAALTDRALKVERFGKRSSRTIYFTVLNPDPDPSTATLTIEKKELGLIGKLGVKELIKGSPIDYRETAASIEIPVNIEGNSTQLIEVTR